MLTANFEITSAAQYVVNVSAQNPALGSAAATNYVRLDAAPFDGCTFVRWSDGNTDNPRYMAYNSCFDFIKTPFAALLDEFEFIDLYLMALQTITHQKGFDKFCHENNFVARSGRSCATGVEAVYAYITRNPDFDTFEYFLAFLFDRL